MGLRNNLIENHYYTAELFEDIVQRLEELGIDTNQVSRSHIAGVDEFHVRGAEVTKELVSGLDINNLKVLDIGCGLGGPSRMFADVFNCDVTGIDISHEFIRTANKLSELVGLSDKTNFLQADALDLPFHDNSFDLVWTQHVQMNIEDKYKFYSEIKRVLRAKGILIYYDIFKNGSTNDLEFPVPWASNPSISFLCTSHETEKHLSDLNFNKSSTIDQTNKGINHFTNLLTKLEKSGSPILGLNVLMGTSTKTKILNLFNGLKNKSIVLQSGVFTK